MLLIKKKSVKQERRTARQFGGLTQPASGAIEGLKGDVRTHGRSAGRFNDKDFLIENKFTDAKSYILKQAVWDKIAKEAIRDNMRTPMLQLDIAGEEYAILYLHDVQEYLGDLLHIACHIEARKQQQHLPGALLKDVVQLNSDVVLGLELRFKKHSSSLCVVRTDELLKALK